MPTGYDWLFPILGYLCGAIPFGVIVARIKGVDLFATGSGNVGATNVGRVLGKKYGYLVFLLDFVKGAAPTSLAVAATSTDTWSVGTGLATVLGHTLSPFLGFRGGKGVATAAGATLILLPISAGLAVLAFACVILAGATMSPASMAAATVLAGSQLSFSGTIADPVAIYATLVAGLVIWRHRSNIHRLRAGTETRLVSLDRWVAVTPPLHSLGLGLWAGGGLFFSLIIAPGLFATFGDLADSSPEWFQPKPLATDLGSRLAGVAVGPIFPKYFAMQCVCGIIAAGTAIGWLLTYPGRSTRWRAAILALALLMVAVGWPVSQHVSDLRARRHTDPEAQSAFGRWHLVSLATNLATLGLLVPGLLLGGRLPGPELPPANSP